MALWQHQGRAGQAGRFVTLIGRPSRSRPLARPDADAAGLLADAGLVLNPDLDRLVCRTVVQRGGKALGDVLFESLHEAQVLGRVLDRVLRAPGEGPLVRDNTEPVFAPPLKVKSSPADPPVMLKRQAQGRGRVR